MSDLSLSADYRIDAVCLEFEAQWKAGARPRMEDYARRATGPEQKALLRELLKVDRDYRQKRGEHPTREEYRERFAEHASVVEALFDPVPEHTTALPAQDQETLAPTEPSIIGRYRVVECLGRGGQGEVYRAVHPSLRQDVVIKCPHPDLPEAACRKLLDEGQILAQLNDSGLVRVLDADTWQGRPFVVFEYVPGRSLAEVIRRERWPARRCAAVVAELAATLQRVHLRGVCHQDLKPANILIDTAGVPRLLDFGLASLVQPLLTIPPPEGISGTLAYMAPEQARGQSDAIGPCTDVFGLGAVLYHLLTGQPPYQGTSRTAVLQQAREGRVKPPREINPAVPGALERICQKAMAADPEQRYGSAAEMGKALRGYLARGRLVGLGVAAGVVATALALVLWLVPWAKKPALEGELQVRVWSVDEWSKVGLAVDQVGALPVRNDERIQIEARLNQPGHVYLLWIGSSGKVYPLYPWNDGPQLLRKDLVTPPRREAAAVVYSPAARRAGWKMTGKSGLETILMGARRTPLPDDVSLVELFSDLPVAPLHNRQEWARLRDLGSSLDVDRSGDFRDPGEESVQIDHPIVGVMERLREHFEVVQAVRFAHQE